MTWSERNPVKNFLSVLCLYTNLIPLILCTLISLYLKQACVWQCHSWCIYQNGYFNPERIVLPLADIIEMLALEQNILDAYYGVASLVFGIDYFVHLFLLPMSHIFFLTLTHFFPSNVLTSFCAMCSDMFVASKQCYSCSEISSSMFTTGRFHFSCLGAELHCSEQFTIPESRYLGYIFKKKIPPPHKHLIHLRYEFAVAE